VSLFPRFYCTCKRESHAGVNLLLSHRAGGPITRRWGDRVDVARDGAAHGGGGVKVAAITARPAGLSHRAHNSCPAPMYYTQNMTVEFLVSNQQNKISLFPIIYPWWAGQCT
jgi:hypothetical protein